jgi:hypothetical protein
MADFLKIEPGLKSVSVRLDAKHTREIALFTADDYRRRPRDPVTGRPTKP